MAEHRSFSLSGWAVNGETECFACFPPLAGGGELHRAILGGRIITGGGAEGGNLKSRTCDKESVVILFDLSLADVVGAGGGGGGGGLFFLRCFVSSG